MIALPQVDAAVRRVAKMLADGAPTVAVMGPPTSGRSTVLARLQEELGGRAVHLALPSMGDDAAAVALVRLASELEPQHGGLVEEVTSLTRSWDRKLDLVVGALASDPNTVLLFDEPVLTSSVDAPPDIFSQHVGALTRRVLSVKGIKRVVAVPLDAPTFGAEAVELELASHASEVLDLLTGRSSLSSAAEGLRRAGGAQLDLWSPLELRLAVALLSLGRDAGEVLQLRGRSLSRVLVETVSDARIAIAVALNRLSLVRLPFDEELLESVGAPKVETEAGRFMREVFLYEVDGRYVLHDIIAEQLRQVRGVHDRQPDHSLLAKYYKQRFEKAASDQRAAAAVRFEMEAVHHYTEGGDMPSGVRLYFVDQYDALGKALSLAGKHREAVVCYESSLRYDEDDAYAHHYKAFNLDIDGLRPDEVERHYRRAIERDPTHVWYHGRYICFLITRGRARDARAAWSEAMAALALAGAFNYRWGYEELHKPVARLLLHRGQLDFAEEVLHDITEPRTKSFDWCRALSRQLETMRAAARGEVVFPPMIAPEDRWCGPHLVEDDDTRARVESWTPGRVDHLEGDKLVIRFAQRDGDAVRYGWREMSGADFRARSNYPRSLPIPAGTFVEMVVLKAPEEEVVLRYNRQLADMKLPKIVPHPERYLRRGAPAAR